MVYFDVLLDLYLTYSINQIDILTKWPAKL